MSETLNATMRCDVCGALGIIGVASSALGAISFAYCRPCAVNGAEPRGILEGMVLDMMSGPPPFTPEVETANWLLDGVSTLVDGEYVIAREALKLPTDAEIARYLDDGCPTDLEGWAFRVMQEQIEKTEISNAIHCSDVPHENCGCSCSCCWLTCNAAKPAQKGADDARSES
jgi:hypothetical protein